MTDYNDSSTVQSLFARLARERQLTDRDFSIMRSFEQLTDGAPSVTDGRTTVANICAEAGISRATYYRSPVASVIREVQVKSNSSSSPADLTAGELARVVREFASFRSERAAEIRELRATISSYANQIQILALRNDELQQALDEKNNSPHVSFVRRGGTR